MKTFNPNNYTVEDARHELQFMDDEELKNYISYVRGWKVNKKNKNMYDAWIQIAEELEM